MFIGNPPPFTPPKNYNYSNLLNKIFPPGTLQLIRKFPMPITQRVLKKFSCNYYLPGIDMTGTNCPEPSHYFPTIHYPQKNPGLHPDPWG
jgi:hypothetical protein